MVLCCFLLGQFSRLKVAWFWQQPRTATGRTVKEGSRRLVGEEERGRGLEKIQNRGIEERARAGKTQFLYLEKKVTGRRVGAAELR
ncbi:hypothetical protein E3N88_12878 [Mikania micrantha]|uniref:Secreted protein n=1 Tax=Mikania micrantha TaxID=192012 RepID=A0A5N6P829_9ASTR|nr:hypothetical protein E3N88_12878 [Mikania micrantha]